MEQVAVVDLLVDHFGTFFIRRAKNMSTRNASPCQAD